ncbi:SGNH/GDSL hydrolase family protein [Chitinophaga sp. MM2321]|uniref:SGNH/GDSL hydrolase family protein n=1 Tax=Chitinophaga sp. MM2321 TaxID=3137178 RepID=UPI0032D593C3
MNKGFIFLSVLVCLVFIQCATPQLHNTQEALVTRSVITSTKGICIGNSTVAAYLGGAAVASLLFTDEEIAKGYSCHSLAVPGHTIYQQLNAWKAYQDKDQADWIIIEIGLNDLKPTDALDATLDRYQKLIDTINLTKKTGAKLLLATMTPCKQRLINIYKENAMVSYKKWMAMNNAIMGKGPHAITGVDHRFNGHTIMLMDKAGNLKAEYEVPEKDRIHENTAGRLIIASHWRLALAAAGYLP